MTPVLAAWFIWYAADSTTNPRLRAARAEVFLSPHKRPSSVMERFILTQFDRPHLRVITVRVAGYPWPCLAGARALYDNEDTADLGLLPSGGAPSPPGPFFLVRSIVRRRRKPAGLCIECGYDLRATPPDAPCPECGEHARSTGR